MKRFGKICLCLVLLCSVFLLSACGDTPKGGIDEGRVYGISFVTGVDGLEIDAQVIDEGGRVSVPDVPLRAGYKFVGWKVGDSFWNFSVDKVFSSFEMIAVWEKDEDSWAYTDGLVFSFNALTDSYEVSGYLGTEGEVVLPLYYNGPNGGKAVTKIADSAFAGDSIIKKISIRTQIGNSSFAGSSIEEVEFLSLVDISDSAFSGTALLKRVTFKTFEGEMKIGASAFAGSGIESFVVPDGVTQIGASAFAGSDLQTIKFGSLSKLYEIQASAFYNTSLTGVKLPESLAKMGDSAFANNRGLRYVIFPTTLKTVGGEIFRGCDELDAIYFTSGVKPDVLLQNPEWRGVDCLEYYYSPTDKGVSRYWGSLDVDGVPVLYQKPTTYSIDLSGIGQYLPMGCQSYVLIVDGYYPLSEHSYAYMTLSSSLDENFVGQVVMDAYKIENYSIRVHLSSDDSFNASELALMLAFDVDSSLTNLVATGFDPESKMILFN